MAYQYNLGLFIKRYYYIMTLQHRHLAYVGLMSLINSQRGWDPNGPLEQLNGQPKNFQLRRSTKGQNVYCSFTECQFVAGIHGMRSKARVETLFGSNQECNLPKSFSFERGEETVLALLLQITSIYIRYLYLQWQRG